jgi:hypothetical protein
LMQEPVPGAAPLTPVAVFSLVAAQKSDVAIYLVLSMWYIDVSALAAAQNEK